MSFTCTGEGMVASGVSPEAACSALLTLFEAAFETTFSFVPSGGWSAETTSVAVTELGLNEYWGVAVVAEEGGVDPPTPAASGTTVTCSVSPCVITVENTFTHTVTVAPPVASVENFLEMNELASAFILVLIAVWGGRKLYDFFDRSPNEG